MASFANVGGITASCPNHLGHSAVRMAKQIPKSSPDGGTHK
jgi:hypothetical protein